MVDLPVELDFMIHNRLSGESGHGSFKGAQTM